MTPARLAIHGIERAGRPRCDSPVRAARRGLTRCASSSASSAASAGRSAHRGCGPATGAASGALRARPARTRRPVPRSPERAFQAAERQRVGHLVGEQHAAQRRRGQPVQPLDALGQLRREPCEPRALPRAQVGAHLEDRVARRQHAERRPAREHGLGERAAPGAELQHLAPAGARRAPAAHGPSRAPRGRTARELRRGREVARGAELGGAGAVIAEPRRIQHLLEVLDRSRSSHRPRRSARPAPAATRASWAAWLHRAAAIVMHGHLGHKLRPMTTNPARCLAGQVALVSGGARRVGAEIVR